MGFRRPIFYEVDTSPKRAMPHEMAPPPQETPKHSRRHHSKRQHDAEGQPYHYSFQLFAGNTFE
jgi:hypothetical protein